MKGRYDDLSQEMWGVADDDIPQDYLKAIVAQTLPPKRREPVSDSDLDGSDKLKAIWARLKGREMPRFGQPSFDAELVEWYREYQFRNKHPLWYESEYHFLDDGTLIHEIKK